MSLVLFLLCLGFLITIHELGHFLVAKACGVGVYEFAVGFGPTIFRLSDGVTQYSLRAIPLGGFVKMAGEDLYEIYEQQDADGEGSTEDEEAPGEDDKEQITFPQEQWLVSKNYWQKLSIVAAGPIANILFALIASILLIWSVGAPVYNDDAIVGSLIPNYPAEKAGVLVGDRVLKVAGEAVDSWSDMAKRISAQGGETFAVLVERVGETGELEQKEISLTAQLPDEERKVLIETTGAKPRYQIGIGPKEKERRPVSLGEGVLAGFGGIWFTTKITLIGLWKVITQEISADNLGGPVMIISEGVKAAEAGFAVVVDFSIFLSMSLAILNLLPIPVLDGGHIVIFTLEKIRGKRLSFKVLLLLHQIGFLFLIALMIYATKNDIVRLFSS